MPPPSVTVIVPVKDDPRLARCLEALSAQDYAGDLRIVVADNGSAESPAEQVAQHGATLVEERRPGSYAARNAAVERSTGDILAFTDSDCVPRPDWVRRGVEALLAAPDPAFVGGRIEIFPRDPHRPTLTELYDVGLAFPQRAYLETDHYAVTANLFVRRADLLRTGGFDGSRMSGGDRDWGARSRSYGITPVYAADAVVAHPARESFSELAEKVTRINQGTVDRHAAAGDPVGAHEVVREALVSRRILREAVATGGRVRRRDLARFAIIVVAVRAYAAGDLARRALRARD